MSRTLTLETLKSKKACREQVELFQKLFGDSVEITPELCIKHAKDFNFYWASKKILSNAAYDKYRVETNAAWDKYCDEINVASNKYRDKKIQHGTNIVPKEHRHSPMHTSMMTWSPEHENEIFSIRYVGTYLETPQRICSVEIWIRHGGD